MSELLEPEGSPIALASQCFPRDFAVLPAGLMTAASCSIFSSWRHVLRSGEHLVPGAALQALPVKAFRLRYERKTPREASDKAMT